MFCLKENHVRSKDAQAEIRGFYLDGKAVWGEGAEGEGYAKTSKNQT